MKKFYVPLLICALFGNSIHAQDPEFTQFYANPVYLNPAFAGASKCPRLIMNYRNQWPGLSGTFVTYAASYDAHVDALSGGVGLMLMQDNQASGTINTSSVSGVYAYQWDVNRFFSVKTGFQATYFSKTLNWEKLNFNDQIDPIFGFIYPTAEAPSGRSAGAPDFSVGMLGYSEKFYAGFAVHHLTQPDVGFEDSPAKLPRKYTVHAGANIPIKKHAKDGTISPNILVQRQGDFTQVNMGLYVSKGPVVGGLWYRNQDSFIVLVGLQTDVFKLGYSYDVTVSKLSNSTYGSHEISFAILFPCKEKRIKFRPPRCPSF